MHLNLGDVIKVLEIRDMTCLRFLPTVHKVVVTGLGLVKLNLQSSKLSWAFLVRVVCRGANRAVWSSDALG